MTSPTTERRRGLLGSTGFKAPVTVLAAANVTQYGEQTIDGKALLAVNADGVPDRVACVGQTDATLNGIWDVSTAAWTRSLDANQNYDLKKGTTVIVTDGNTYAGTYWQVTAANPITLGTRLITWARALANSLSTLYFLAAGVGAVLRGAQDKMRERVSPEDFGATGNGVTDDTANFQKAVTAAYGGVLELTTGNTYSLTSTLALATTAGLHVIGHGATLLTNQSELITCSGNCSNITFEGVKFNSTAAAGPGFYGLFTSVGKVLSNIRFIDCDFTAPLCPTDAIKIDVGFVGKTATGILVQGCRFHSMGQMGVDMQNHLFDGVQRFFDVRIVDNEFDGLGEASIYGMSVSLSGEGANCIIANNTITDADDIAIECVGAQTDLTIEANTIRACKANCTSIFVSKGGGGAINNPKRVSVIGNVIDGATGGFFTVTNVVDGTISGNVVNGSHKVSLEVLDGVAITGNSFRVTQSILFLTLSNCVISGNRCQCLTDVASYQPTLSGCTNCVATGNYFRSARQAGLSLDGVSSYNVISGNVIDNSDAGASASAALLFFGAGVTNNAAFGNVMKVAATGNTYIQGGGAAGNYVNGTLASREAFGGDQTPAPLTLAVAGAGYLQPVRLGASYVWADSTTRLRISSTLPSTDTSGTVVGTQV